MKCLCRWVCYVTRKMEKILEEPCWLNCLLVDKCRERHVMSNCLGVWESCVWLLVSYWLEEFDWVGWEKFVK